MLFASFSVLRRGLLVVSSQNIIIPNNFVSYLGNQNINKNVIPTNFIICRYNNYGSIQVSRQTDKVSE